MSPRPRRLAVIGAGVSGLAAAVELVRLAKQDSTPLSMALFESSNRPGGKVLTTEFSGAPVDLGAESLLARGTEVEAAIGMLGLRGALIRPATTSASIWNGRRLVAIPKDSVLGVPLHPLHWDVVGAVGPVGAARAALEPVLRRGAPDPDGSLGDFVGRRMGRAVFDRLVDPMLSGVYAGRSRELSSGAVAPQLVAAAATGGSLLRGLRRADRAAPAGDGSTPFVSLEGGLGRLVDALVSALPERSLRLAHPALGVVPQEGRRVRVHSHGEPPADFDGVILALPAPAAASLLAPTAAGMGSLLRQLEYSSVATVSLAYPEGGFSGRLVGSGFLAIRRPRRVLTACTFMDRKWPQLRQPGVTILRASVGSFGDEWALALDDATLVTSVHRELRLIVGLTGLPVDARVERWHGSLPQYRSGHLAWRARVAQASTELPAPIELTGAAFGGVGIAACLRDGAASAKTLWGRLSQDGDSGSEAVADAD